MLNLKCKQQSKISWTCSVPLEFIADDELVEVTPENIRLRKIILSKELRMKALSKAKKEGWDT